VAVNVLKECDRGSNPKGAGPGLKGEFAVENWKPRFDLLNGNSVDQRRVICYECKERDNDYVQTEI